MRRITQRALCDRGEEGTVGATTERNHDWTETAQLVGQPAELRIDSGGSCFVGGGEQ
jgi:hypothetical protein